MQIPIRFAATFSNSLPAGKEHQAVYQKVTGWVNKDPALSLLMSPDLTPDTNFNVTLAAPNSDYRVYKTSPFSNGPAFDLGKNPQNVQARKKTILKDVLRELIFASAIYEAELPNPMKALVKNAAAMPPDTVREVLGGALKSLRANPDYSYKIPVAIRPAAIELPAVDVFGQPNLLPADVRPKDAILLTRSGAEEFYTICRTLMKKLNSDPALLFALQDSVSPKVRLRLQLEPEVATIPQAGAESGQREQKANLALMLEFPDGKAERISLGNSLAVFRSRQSLIRNELLTTLARKTQRPVKVLAALDAFARQHTNPIPYFDFVTGTFQALSQAGV